MRPRVPLKLLEFAPLVAGVLVLAVWFSTPGPLRGQMLAMSASHVPEVSMAYPTDRNTVASTWLEEDVRTRASRSWADVAFKEAARKTSVRVADRFDGPSRDGTASPFMFANDSVQFSPLRDFVRRFPDTYVDAYLVEEPPMPPVVLSGGAPLGTLPSSPFAAGWTASEGKRRGKAFDPTAWNGYSANATDSRVYTGWEVAGDNEVFSYSWQTDANPPKLYRGYVFVPPVGMLGDVTPETVNRSAGWATLKRVHEDLKVTNMDRANAAWCAACHVSHTSTSDRLGDQDPESTRIATALYAGGPVAVKPMPQFSNRNRADSASIGVPPAMYALATTEDTAYMNVPTNLAPFVRRPYASVIWVVPDLPEGGGQTMLFVATYGSDPHGAFTAWRQSWLGQTVMGTRLWLALQFPWLLTVACTLAGVSLVASPLAFAADRRISRRSEASRELARIQRDAHDRVYNRMGALSKRVDGVAANVQDDTAKDLTHVAEDIRATLTDLQAILGGERDRDGELEGTALLAQLRATAVAQAALHGIVVELIAPELLPNLPARLGWDLQCVLDEAITNAARHGQATRLQVGLSVEPAALTLNVHDDGTGGPPHDATTREPTGITGMSERLAEWGGSARLEHRADGSTLTATVPLPARNGRRTTGP